MTDRLTMQDPRAQYPKPPFPRQPQPAPGLAQRMKPSPDHGEKSYTGSGRLKGRKALITGGDSGIGRAAAIAYAREGADVAIAYLPSEETDADEVLALIKAEGRKALGLPGDIKSEVWCRDLVQQTVDTLGGLDILVVNAARQQFRDSIADVSTDDFDQTMKTNLYALHWIVQAASPHLPPGASVILRPPSRPTTRRPSCSIMPQARRSKGRLSGAPFASFLRCLTGFLEGWELQCANSIFSSSRSAMSILPVRIIGSPTPAFR